MTFGEGGINGLLGGQFHKRKMPNLLHNSFVERKVLAAWHMYAGQNCGEKKKEKKKEKKEREVVANLQNYFLKSLSSFPKKMFF